MASVGIGFLVNPVDALALAIAAGGFVLSVATSIFIAGSRWGQVRTEIAILTKAQETAATKDELAGVKESLAEIKGMFRLSLREPG